MPSSSARVFSFVEWSNFSTLAALWSFTMLSRFLSSFLWNFFREGIIPATKPRNRSEGNTSGMSKPPESFLTSFTNDINSSWSLHFFPKATLAVMWFIKVNSFSLRLTVRPWWDDWLMEITKFHTSSSLMDLNDITRLALKISTNADLPYLSPVIYIRCKNNA